MSRILHNNHINNKLETTTTQLFFVVDMGVYANQHVDTVLECQVSKTGLVQAIDDFFNIYCIILSSDVMFGGSHYCDLLDMSETLYNNDMYMADPFCLAWDLIPYIILSRNKIVTSMARMHLSQCRASQSFCLSITRWSVDDVSNCGFRPLYCSNKHEFREIYYHFDIATFPYILANHPRCTPEETFML